MALLVKLHAKTNTCLHLLHSMEYNLFYSPWYGRKPAKMKKKQHRTFPGSLLAQY